MFTRAVNRLFGTWRSLVAHLTAGYVDNRPGSLIFLVFVQVTALFAFLWQRNFLPCAKYVPSLTGLAILLHWLYLAQTVLRKCLA